LDTGSVQREYGGYTSQISSVSFRPLEKEAVTTNSGEDMEPDAREKDENTASQQDPSDVNSESEEVKTEPNGLEPLGKDPNIMLTTSIDGNCLIWDRREPSVAARRLNLPDKTPPWCLSVSLR
jgi:transcriptional activator SPT8